MSAERTDSDVAIRLCKSEGGNKGTVLASSSINLSDVAKAHKDLSAHALSLWAPGADRGTAAPLATLTLSTLFVSALASVQQQPVPAVPAKALLAD